MKKFKFDLEKILDLRKLHEEECKVALGRAISILNEIESDILKTASERHSAAVKKFQDISNLILWDNYILRLDRQSEQLMEQAAQAEIIVEEKRAEYIEASRELKALEKIREMKTEEYKKKAEAERAAEIDELISSRMTMQIRNNN